MTFSLHSGPHPIHYFHNLQYPPFLLIAMNAENRPQVTNEPVESEKLKISTHNFTNTMFYIDAQLQIITYLQWTIFKPNLPQMWRQHKIKKT